MADIKYRLIIEGDDVSVKAVENVDEAVVGLEKHVDETNETLKTFDREMSSTADGAKKLDSSVDKLEDGVDDLSGSVVKASKDADKFSDRLNATGARATMLATKLGDVSQRAIGLGSSLTMKLSLPLLAVGGASVKVAADFESSMAKMQALVGLTADEVATLRAHVLSLSGATAKAPQELGDAMFVVTSAGLRGAAAMSTLTAAAKASAAGLGETVDIARAVAGAVNAYGASVLDASDATDIIVATARAGNFETSQLAAALGRVLPFAQQAKASFEDVGGAVALLTRTNGDAAMSITQVQALMRAFVVPTVEAITALREYGLTAGEVRDSIGENGLVATLTMLDKRLGGNREVLGRLLGSSEAASAAFQILGADAKTISETFGVTNRAVGMTQEAFEIMQNTAGFKMSQAFTNLKRSSIQLGDALVPVVESITNAVSTAAGWFAQLDEKQMSFLINVGKFAVVVGPAILMLGKFGAALSAFGLKLGIATGGITLLVGAIGAIATALYLQEGGFEAFSNFAKATVDLVKSYFAELPKNMLAMANLMFEVLKAPFNFLTILARDIASQIVGVFKDIPSALLMAVRGDTQGAFDLLASNFKAFGETLSDTWAATLEDLNDRTFDFSDDFKLNAQNVATTAVALGSKIREAFTFDITGSNADQLTTAQLQTAARLNEMADEYQLFTDKIDERIKKSNETFMQDITTRTAAKTQEVKTFTELELFRMNAIDATDQIVQQSAERYIESNMDRVTSMASAVKQIANIAMREMKIYLALTIAAAVRKSFTSTWNPIAGAVMGAIATAAVTTLFSAIPQFERGGLVKGDRQIIEINERGEEFVVNAESTKQAMPLLKMINENPRRAKQIVNQFNEFSDVTKNDVVYSLTESADDSENKSEISPTTNANPRDVYRHDSTTLRITDKQTRSSDKRMLESSRTIIQKESLDRSALEQAISMISKSTTFQDRESVEALESMFASASASSSSYHGFDRDRSDASRTASVITRATSDRQAVTPVEIIQSAQSVEPRESTQSTQSMPIEYQRVMKPTAPAMAIDAPVITFTDEERAENRSDIDPSVERPERERRAPRRIAIDTPQMQNDEPEEEDIFARIRRAFFDRDQTVESSERVYDTVQQNSADEIESTRSARDMTTRSIDRYSNVSNSVASSRDNTIRVVVDVVGKIDNEVIRIANERATEIERRF